VDQCDLCGWGTSTMNIRIADVDPRTANSEEMYRTCLECFRKLTHPNHVLFDHILRTTCHFCRKRFGLVTVRFMTGNEMYQNNRCCTKCLPHVRNEIERYNNTYNNLYNRHRDERVYIEAEQPRIEIKDNLCYIWNPKKVEVVRENDMGTRTLIHVRIEMGGHATRPDLSNAIGCRRAFIHDGELIWILKRCVLEAHTLDRRGLDASFFSVSYNLTFIVTEFETRNTDHELERRRQNSGEIQMGNVLDSSGRVWHHNQLYTTASDAFDAINELAGSDWGTLGNHDDLRIRLGDDINIGRSFVFPEYHVEEGDTVSRDTRNELFAREFSLDYTRALGRNVNPNTPINDVHVWCSCGFNGYTNSLNADFRHSHLHVNVEHCLHGPGSSFSVHVPNHIVTFTQARAQS
jgi:hypothetical protein